MSINFPVALSLNTPAIPEFNLGAGTTITTLSSDSDAFRFPISSAGSFTLFDPARQSGVSQYAGQIFVGVTVAILAGLVLTKIRSK